MTETIVHVTTLEEWKSVLDVWFKQGYEWQYGADSYHEEYFVEGQRYLRLCGESEILQGNINLSPYEQYSEFMAQQKEDNQMETFYVTQEQLDLIEELKYAPYPAYELLNPGSEYRQITRTLDSYGEKALLRYIGGDETIEFKVKEQLYRLWRIDSDGERVYMKFSYGTPTWITDSNFAFTAPLDEIKKWQTPAWEIEKVEVQ